MRRVATGLAGFFCAVASFACTDDSIRYEPDEWTGSTSALSIGSVYEDTGCPPTIMENVLRRHRLPTALIETTDGKVTLYVGSNPSESPGPGSVHTQFRLNEWELWRWAPRDDPVNYHYILMPHDGTDAVLYQRVRSDSCRLDRFEAVSGE
jgi:hypothetical protein